MKQVTLNTLGLNHLCNLRRRGEGWRMVQPKQVENDRLECVWKNQSHCRRPDIWSDHTPQYADDGVGSSSGEPIAGLLFFAGVKVLDG